MEDLRLFWPLIMRARINAVSGNIAGNAIKLNYYIFQTDVLIRGAKWTN